MAPCQRCECSQVRYGDDWFAGRLGESFHGGQAHANSGERTRAGGGREAIDRVNVAGACRASSGSI